MTEEQLKEFLSGILDKVEKDAYNRAKDEDAEAHVTDAINRFMNEIQEIYEGRLQKELGDYNTKSMKNLTINEYAGDWIYICSLMDKIKHTILDKIR